MASKDAPLPAGAPVRSSGRHAGKEPVRYNKFLEAQLSTSSDLSEVAKDKVRKQEAKKFDATKKLIALELGGEASTAAAKAK